MVPIRISKLFSLKKFPNFPRMDVHFLQFFLRFKFFFYLYCIESRFQISLKLNFEGNGNGISQGNTEFFKKISLGILYLERLQI